RAGRARFSDQQLTPSELSKKPGSNRRRSAFRRSWLKCGLTGNPLIHLAAKRPSGRCPTCTDLSRRYLRGTGTTLPPAPMLTSGAAILGEDRKYGGTYQNRRASCHRKSSDRHLGL